MSSSKQKANRNTSNKTFGQAHVYDIFYIRCVTMKFHDVAVQNNVKEMYKKVCCTVMQSCFFDQLDVLIFLPTSLPLPVNITQFYFFFV